MDETEQLKIKIQKLESEKENVKFGYNQISFYYLSILVFLGTLAISSIGVLPSIFFKIMSGIVYLILMTGLFFGFRKPLKDRERKLNDIAKEINKLYEELLTK